MTRTPISMALTSAFAVAAVVGVLWLRGSLEGLELAVYDRYLRTVGLASEPDPRLLIVLISEDDVRRYSYPVSDATLAQALRGLATAGAAVIGLDLYRDIPVPPGAGELAELLRREERIVAVEKFDAAGRGIPGPPALRGSERVGFNDLPLDFDNRVRRGLLFMDDGHREVRHSFALRVALTYVAADGIRPGPDPEQPEWLRLGDSTLRPFSGRDGGYAGADDAGYQILLDCHHGASGLERTTLGSLLDGDVGPERIRGRIVLIGQSSESVRDYASVPCGSETDRGSLLPGVEIHGHLISQLVRLSRGETRPLRVPEEWQEATGIAFFALLGSALGLGLRSIQIAVPALLVGLVGFALGGAALYRMQVWWPVAAPALSWTGAMGLTLLWSGSRERAQRRLLMRLFSTYVAPEVADAIWTRRDELLEHDRLRAQQLPATVAFLDIRGFTPRAEKLDPALLLEWLNDVLEPLAQGVAARGGVVDDYFGDGLKANFGVPLPRDYVGQVAQDARNAARWALSVQPALVLLNAEHRGRGLPEVQVRIGLNSGTVVAGSLGSVNRLKYTTVGDVVVTAQRLESFDQLEHDFESEPVRILLSGATRELLGDDFELRRLGTFTLPGRQSLIEVFQLVGEVARDG